jgi:hypothetical protein
MTGGVRELDQGAMEVRSRFPAKPAAARQLLEPPTDGRDLIGKPDDRAVNGVGDDQFGLGDIDTEYGLGTHGAISYAERARHPAAMRSGREAARPPRRKMVAPGA